jgi:hypothetical protein
VMAFHQIDDIRHFQASDLRFLRQFGCHAGERR